MYRMNTSKITKWAGYIAFTILVAFICKVVYWKFMPKGETEGMTVQRSGGRGHRGRWGPPPYVYRGSTTYSSGSGYYGYGYYYPYYDIPVLYGGYYKEKQQKDHYALTLFFMFCIMTVFALLLV